MANKTPRRPSRRPHEIHKPNGAVHPRVQKVGPEHFGFVSVDCAKARSKWMLADFYGNVLVGPTQLNHVKPALRGAVEQIREAAAKHGILDLIVVVERTGRYHHAVRDPFVAMGLEVRVVHPLATKQFRQPADPGNKTDDTDLSAIHRAAVNGFGLAEHEPDPAYVSLRLLVRHRRKLVQKRVTIQQQMLEHLQSFMPGYSRCFTDIFGSPIGLWVPRNLGSATAILEAGVAGLSQQAREAGLKVSRSTLEKIVAWAHSAPLPEEPASLHRRIFLDLDADQLAKARCIRGIEGELAGSLARTPYVLLLSIVGINVVSAAEFAGEMGPIEHYPNARAITGRAGLYPSRYQSDEVDRSNGSLVRHANRDLRYAILMIADNLIKCNDYFGVLAAGWRLKGKDTRDIRVRAAGRFGRIAYQMVAGRTTFRHPCARRRDYILAKLIRFAVEHSLAPDQLARDLDAAASMLPGDAHQEEAAALRDELARVRKQRGSGPIALGAILPAILAKLEVNLVESTRSGEADPTE